jgi:DNA-binding LacI/PurR family transcriptional regulator
MAGASWDGVGGRRATIYDVAREAQVSHETVSRVLKGNPSVKPQNRRRVQEALASLNYRPNAAARALATRRSHRIGAMVYDLVEAGPSQFIKGASSAALEAGYLLDIVSMDSVGADAVENAVELLGQSELAGIIAITPTDRMREIVENTPFLVPLFQEIEPDISEPGALPSLNATGEELVVDHLVQLGHRRILHIGGPHDWVSARNRALAYGRAMLKHSLEPLPVIEGDDWSAASGYAAAQQIPLDDDITALVVGNDQMALGVLLLLHERGVAVPGHMSVVGFDNIRESAFTIPPLTTVSLDFQESGRRAVRALLSKIDGTALPPEAAEDDSRAYLVVRASSGPVPRIG